MKFSQNTNNHLTKILHDTKHSELVHKNSNVETLAQGMILRDVKATGGDKEFLDPFKTMYSLPFPNICT